jgi:hypothetical protein
MESYPPSPFGRKPCYAWGKVGVKMSSTIGANNSAGPVSFSSATASDAVDKILELEQQKFENITIKNGAGRMIDLDELSALCEASED